MKKNLTNNIILKILSVIFAIMLWLVVINIEDPEKTSTFRDIPVKLLNENEITDNGQVYKVISGDMASVTVTGPRSIVDALSAGDFIAEADFKDISQTNAIPVIIKPGAGMSKYESRLNILQITNTLHVEIEKIISKEYEIEAGYSGREAANYQLSEPKISVNTVTITAPESIISVIEKVRAIANINERTADLDMEVPLTFYNAAGKTIVIDSSKTQLSISSVVMTAEMLKIKEVPVKYNINAGQVHSAAVIEHHVDKETVKIIGREEYIRDIQEVTIPQNMLNVTGISQTADYAVNLQDILPKHVYPCAGYETITVTVTVEPIITRIFEIYVTDVMIGKIPDGFEASIKTGEKIAVELRARKTLLDKLDAEGLKPYADLSAAVKGENSIKLQMTLPKGVEEVKEVKINVNLTEKAEKEEETTTGVKTEENTEKGSEGSTTGNAENVPESISGKEDVK